MNDVLVIRDIGPIVSASIPVSPGVTVLRGKNEAGKSVAIAAVAALAGRDQSLPLRDGATTGQVSGLGTILSIGKKQRRAGALDVESIEGKVDIADLVDPRLVDPEAAARRRIKALITLQGVELTLDHFREILPEQHRGELTEQDRKADPAEMADKIRRRMHKIAKDVEDREQRLQGEIETLRAQLKELPADGESDEQRLRDALSAAIREQDRLTAQGNASRSVRRKVEAAREQLAAIDDGRTARRAQLAAQLAEAEKDVRGLDGAIHAAEAGIKSLREQLERAERLLADHNQKRDAAHHLAETIRISILSHDAENEQLAAYQLQANAAIPAEPSQDDLDAAAEAVKEATDAIELGARIRRANQLRDQIAEKVTEQTALQRKAAIFRDAAAGTDKVLSDAITSPRLRVVGGDLVYFEADRDPEPFHRLSDGRRWTIVIQEAADAFARLGKPAILPIPQIGWEGLDYENRKLVHDAAIAAGVCIVTAEVASDPNAPEGFEPYRWN